MEWLNRAKAHVVKHKEAYIAGTVGLVVGAAVAVVYCRQKNVAEINMMRIFSPGQNTVDQTVVIELPARGHRGNVIVCEDTGQIFGSQREAAKALNINPGNLSSHLNGKYPHAGGYVFKNLGENLNEEVTIAA